MAVRRRGVIVARIKPGARERVAETFAESDAGPLPRPAGVRHRSHFVLEDLCIHLVDTEDDADGAIDDVRDHRLFRETRAPLEPYTEPDNPVTSRPPKDAMAVELYRWNA
jgi:hypothetical protein